MGQENITTLIEVASASNNATTLLADDNQLPESSQKPENTSQSEIQNEIVEGELDPLRIKEDELVDTNNEINDLNSDVSSILNLKPTAAVVDTESKPPEMYLEKIPLSDVVNKSVGDLEMILQNPARIQELREVLENALSNLGSQAHLSNNDSQLIADPSQDMSSSEEEDEHKSENEESEKSKDINIMTPDQMLGTLNMGKLRPDLQLQESFNESLQQSSPKHLNPIDQPVSNASRFSNKINDTRDKNNSRNSTKGESDKTPKGT